MNEKNDTGFDLNLVRVFLAIWDLRSLTAAGERLHLSQPAISHALKRLRARFGDPLFVRTGSAMLPTDAATRLHDPLQRAFGLVSQALQDHGAFDPDHDQRQFRIAMSDVSELYFLPRLFALLGMVAPQLRIDIVPLAVGGVGAMLRAGEVDMAIGHLPELEQECTGYPLFTDRLICLLRAGHPVADAGLNRDNFGSLRHIHAGTSAPGHQLTDQRLGELGIRRSVAVRIGHLTAAPGIVAATDLAVIYPESLALSINGAGDFALLPLPFDIPAIEVKAHTHPRFGRDKGIRWLLAAVADVCAAPIV